MVTTPKPKPKESPSLPRPEVLPSEILERDGWCKGHFFSHSGAVCLVTAWNRAIGALLPGRKTYWPTPFLILESVVSEYADSALLPDGRIDILSWNDAPGRDFLDVIRVSIEAEKRLGWRE